MRVLLFVLGALALTVSAAGTAALDLHGTARAGERPQANAVVWLESPNAAPSPEAKRPVLDQRNLDFSPHVLAVRVGARVEFPNHDRVFHNVFSFRDGKKFDLGLYPVGSPETGAVRQAGTEPDLLQHPPEHGGVRHGRGQPYFASPTSAALHDPVGARRHVHVPRVATRADPSSPARSRSMPHSRSTFTGHENAGASLRFWCVCASAATAQVVATEVRHDRGLLHRGGLRRRHADARLRRGPGGHPFFGEGAWGARYFTERGRKAQPTCSAPRIRTENRAQLIEAYGERTFTPGRGLVGMQAGRYRTPFGIYGRSDHAYSGFLRAPLIRYDDYFALSNNFLEHGADLIVGAPRRSSKRASACRPTSAWRTAGPGIDTVIRGQAYYGSAIVGVSYNRALPTSPSPLRKDEPVFTGVDFRWMHGGVQVRGEWITGQPFDGTTTTGATWICWFIASGMGPVTAVARLEQLDYDMRRRSSCSRGARRPARRSACRAG